MSSDDILSHLNPAQQEAVIATEGPVLILAGPGSGKTRCITYKVAYLIKEKKVDPESIVTLTFTNKAANEMRQRVARLLLVGGWLKKRPFMGTFHSFCSKILRRDGKNIGISPNFTIFNEADQLDIVKQAMRELKISTRDFNPKAILATISAAKNELISEDDYSQYAKGFFQETVAKIFPHYQKLLSENEALDFDDLLTKNVKLFKEAPEILSKYQSHFRYILVDEYQDTNHAQYILTKLLADRWRNLCVVGDASQSIYGFRGADYRNVLNLKNDFPEIKIFNIEQNYRSTQKILDAAFFVISQNTTHPILKLWTKNPQGEPPFLYEAKNEQDEANIIINQVVSSGNSLSDFVVLYRTNAQSRVFEEALLHAGLPYLLVGGVRFYERREIKDILAFLRILANPKDMVSYKRIEKLGKRRLRKFLEWVDNTRDTIDKLTTLEIMDDVLEITEYTNLYDPKDREDLSRLENIKELRSVATEFPNLSQLLENVALIQQEYLPDQRPTFANQKPEVITLMTVHAAKGLEFPVVFMTGMEEGLFPHSRSLMDKLELEEERRLCYVGITRAKEKLYFTFARRRLYFGNRVQNPISQFILDIPENLIKVVNYPKSYDF